MPDADLKSRLLPRGRRRYNVAVVSLRGILLLILTLAAPIGAVEVIDPAEVGVGDTGVCITEIEGGQLLEIPIRVLGVLGPSQPQGELVIIRLEHPRFEETGVAAGMSGSPVYIGGRLLGALAYSWGFASEPVAGVTPFVHMQNLGEATGSVRGGASPRPTILELANAREQGRLPEFVLDWLLPEDLSRSRTLAVAIGSSGIAGRPVLSGWSADAWSRLGWVDSPAGGGLVDDLPPSEVKPGAMVAGVLVDGDAFLAAGGTVTEVRDGSVWAFGHPFLGTGAVRMPLARASVVTILPSLASSFKMFNVGGTIGVLTSDRTHGVWGRLGETEPLVPLSVSVGEDEFNYGLIDHPVLTPLLAGFMVHSSHAVHGRTFGLQTVDVGLRVDFAGDEDLELRQVFQGVDSAAQGAAWVGAVMAYLQASPFEAPGVVGLEVSLESEDGLTGATLIDVTPSRRRPAPGETLILRARLRRSDGAVESVEIPLEVPCNLAEGRIDVVVADGASWAAYDLGARPLRPASFSDEMRLLRRLGSAATLVAALERAGTSVVLPGGTVAAPIGVTTTLRSALGSNLTTVAHRVLGLAEAETKGPVLGAARIRLDIRRRSGWTREDS